MLRIVRLVSIYFTVGFVVENTHTPRNTQVHTVQASKSQESLENVIPNTKLNAFRAHGPRRAFGA